MDAIMVLIFSGGVVQGIAPQENISPPERLRLESTGRLFNENMLVGFTVCDPGKEGQKVAWWENQGHCVLQDMNSSVHTQSPGCLLWFCPSVIGPS
jgi:hypothetical protein